MVGSFTRELPERVQRVHELKQCTNLSLPNKNYTSLSHYSSTKWGEMKGAYFLVVINLAVISFQGNVTSFYDEHGNVSRVVGVYESANGVIMKLDSLLTPPMPAANRPMVCYQILMINYSRILIGCHL